MRQTKTEPKKMPRPECEIIYEKTGDIINEDILISGIINWQPPYDLYLINETVFISIELPGVDMKDVVLYVGHDRLIISGTKKPLLVNEEIDRNNLVFHTLEISYGKFVRRIDFPMPIEPRNGVYNMENGVLTIKWPVLKEQIIPIEEV